MKQLRRHHAFARTVITKGISALETLLQSPATPALELHLPLNLVVQKYGELKALDQKIQADLSGEQLNADLAAAYDYETQVCQIRTRVHFAMTSANPPGAALVPTAADDRQADASHINPHRPGVPPAATSARFAVLAKLQIPTFSGDRKKWQGFWDHFKATIHGNPALPQIETFKYLLSYLTGKARSAVEGIRLAEEKYDMAVKTLTTRFGRNDMLVEDHIDSLLSLTPVRTSADVERLRDLHYQISFHVNALEGLGVSAVKYAVVLHRVLMKALPPDLAILYHQRVKESPPAGPSDGAATSSDRAQQVQKILGFMCVQVEIREEEHFDHPGVPQWRPFERREPPPPDRSPPSATALLADASPATTGTDSSPPAPNSCPLCAARHSIAEYTAPVPAIEKRRKLQAGGHCFRRGKQNHFARVCRTARSLVCGRCSRRHLTSLCDIASSFKASASKSLAVSFPGSRRSQASGAAPTVTSASASATQLAPVYLQTARAWAKGPRRQLLLRVLLDTGSQRTFIRRDVSHAMTCSIIGVERLTLITFGRSHCTATMRRNRVSVTLQSQHDDRIVMVDALEVPEICAVTSPTFGDKVFRTLDSRGLAAADVRLSDTFLEDQVTWSAPTFIGRSRRRKLRG